MIFFVAKTSIFHSVCFYGAWKILAAVSIFFGPSLAFGSSPIRLLIRRSPLHIGHMLKCSCENLGLPQLYVEGDLLQVMHTVDFFIKLMIVTFKNMAGAY